MNTRIVMGLMCLIGMLIVFPSQVIGSEMDNSSEPEMSISPSDMLYNVTNMKPGDWAPRTIAIKNVGELPFTYDLGVKGNDSDKLFNELLLKISLSNDVLYQGKLADFITISFDKLGPSDRENIDLTIRFPEQLGNEFQGLDTSFSFVFTAENENKEKDALHIDGMVGSGGSKLPSTSTLIFTFLLTGGLLLVSGLLIITYKNHSHVIKNYMLNK